MIAPDVIAVPEIADEHLPGVIALKARIIATVELHNGYARTAATFEQASSEWQGHAQTCAELRARLAALVAVAPAVADAERRMVAHLDRAVDQADRNATVGEVARAAEGGHLRCLREHRDGVAAVLRELRAKVIGERS